MILFSILLFFFFFNDTATTEIYTLSLHDALPICFAEDVDAVRGKPLGVPGQHEPRARRFGGGNLAIEPHVSRERLELQQIAFAVEQVAYLGLRHRGSRSTARRRGAARRRVGSLSSCRRTLATARSSAVRWSAPRAVPTCTAPRPVCNRTSTVGRP